MTIILPANTLSAGGYTVANSCRFNDDDTAYLHRTPGSEGNRKTWTFSCWFKRGNLYAQAGEMRLFGGNSIGCHIYLYNEEIIWDLTAPSSASLLGRLKTNRDFRDPSAWYHLVCAYDTEQATAGNRMRMYINGTEETSFETDTNPDEDLATNAINDDEIHTIGYRTAGMGAAGMEMDGYLAEVVFIDGLQLAPTSFGEFDEDSQTIWKPIDVSGLTFGTNGFYLDFEDSDNLGDDESGNTNDWTEVNLAAADQCVDSPTNNFATLNPLDNAQSDATYSEGNCKWATSTNSHYFWGRSTIGMSAGKWYMEFKATSIPEHGYFGICVDGPDDNTTFLTNGGRNDHVEYGYKTSDGNSYTNTGSSSYGDTYDDGDIIGVALDLTNNKLYFSKNGTWQNSGDPTSGATGTGAISITAAASNGFGEYFFCCADGTSGTSGTFEANFGSPAFTISSGNADANGYGNFEYAVPSGYLALCTKNLGSDGG